VEGERGKDGWKGRRRYEEGGGVGGTECSAFARKQEGTDFLGIEEYTVSGAEKSPVESRGSGLRVADHRLGEHRGDP